MIFNSLSDKLTFGKHKLKSIQTVIEQFTDYFEWMLESPNHKFSTEIIQYFNQWKYLSK